MKTRIGKLSQWFYYGLSVLFIATGVIILSGGFFGGGQISSKNRWLLGSIFVVYGTYRFTGTLLRARRNKIGEGELSEGGDNSIEGWERGDKNNLT